MKSAMETLKPDGLDVVHAGAKRYPLAPGVRALPASELESLPVESVYTAAFSPKRLPTSPAN